MKEIITFILGVLLLSACDHRENLADAYGNFEVDDLVVSAESNGKVLSFNIYEGEQVKEEEQIGVIDTLAIKLQMSQLLAQKQTVLSKIETIKAQIAAQEQQLENANVQFRRVAKLLASGAATQQQEDELGGSVRLLEKQIAASLTQISSIRKEVNVLDEQQRLLELQFDKAHISSPATGVVLEKYVHAGELVATGKPLFKMADLSEMILRCYISGAQLSSVKPGDSVQVAIDGDANSLETMTGVISWISDKAEFTPKIIQTKEERVKLVYAVKVRVKNDGRLKIGMPGEVRF